MRIQDAQVIKALYDHRNKGETNVFLSVEKENGVESLCLVQRNWLGRVLMWLNLSSSSMTRIAKYISSEMTKPVGEEDQLSQGELPQVAFRDLRNKMRRYQNHHLKRNVTEAISKLNKFLTTNNEEIKNLKPVASYTRPIIGNLIDFAAEKSGDSLRNVTPKFCDHILDALTNLGSGAAMDGTGIDVKKAAPEYGSMNAFRLNGHTAHIFSHVDYHNQERTKKKNAKAGTDVNTSGYDSSLYTEFLRLAGQQGLTVVNLSPKDEKCNYLVECGEAISLVREDAANAHHIYQYESTKILHYPDWKEDGTHILERKGTIKADQDQALVTPLLSFASHIADYTIPVLIHCRQGLNRSSTFAALVELFKFSSWVANAKTEEIKKFIISTLYDISQSKQNRVPTREQLLMLLSDENIKTIKELCKKRLENQSTKSEVSKKTD